MIIKRLHELTKKELKSLSSFMRGEIKPDSIGGSDWVCLQRQRPHFWSEEQVEYAAKKDAVTIAPRDNYAPYRAWVGLDGTPVGFCGVIEEPNALLITTFLMDATRTEEEQFQIADEIALEALANLAEREEIYSHFNKEGFAARYATRCGFTAIEPGKPMVIHANPILHWTHHPKKLIEAIKGFQK